MYSQVMSCRYQLDEIDDTRAIAKIIVTTVAEKTNPRASFRRILIRTFQSIVMGIAVTFGSISRSSSYIEQRAVTYSSHP
jgi:hypothetical protein